MTVAQDILAQLAAGGRYTTDALCVALRASRAGAVKASLSHLVWMGYVHGAKQPGTKRRAWGITDKGRAVLKAMRSGKPQPIRRHAKAPEFGAGIPRVSSVFELGRVV